MPAIGCTRNYDYSLRDQAFFLNTWSKLNVFQSPGDSAEEKEREQSENYFDTGLNLDSALHSSKGAGTGNPDTHHSQTDPVIMKSGKRSGGPQSSSDCSRSTPLPRFGLVEKLQRAFNIPDLLKDNPFLNQDAASQMFKRQKTQKRVRFAKVEITEKHLPNCRRNSFSKQEFGHLHSPACSNYKAEQSLCKQEFLIRGNFIRDNAKTATSECEFYNAPVRHVEPLNPRLVTPTLVPPHGSLHLDLKNSTMDSITYHDKNSPGLRYTANPVQDTEKEPATSSSSSSADSFAPNPNYKPMPCQPIFSNDIIIGPPPRSRDVVVDNKSEMPLTETKRQGNLPELRIPEISVIPAGPNSPGVCDVVGCDDLKLLPDAPDKKTRTGSDSSSVDSGGSSVDSGYDSKCGDFLDDFLDNMSEDSESESLSDDTDETISEGTTFEGISGGATKESESDSETVMGGPLSSTSLPTVECSSSSSESDLEEVEPDALIDQHDSGISSLSDNEEEIDDLIKSRLSVIRSVIPVPTKPHTWSTAPSTSVQPAVAPVKNEKPAVPPQQTFQIREGYVNPFSKRKTESSVVLKHAPSVLGRLICETRSRNSELVRNPDLAPDRFMFDCPSPDDVIRIRQAGVVSC